MKESRCSEAQMMGVLGEQAAGAEAEDLCREHGFDQQRFCR